LRELGVSKKQAHDWRKIEAALADPDRKPTTAGIIAA